MRHVLDPCAIITSYQMQKTIDDDVIFGDGVAGRDLNVRLELKDSTNADVVLEVPDHVRVNSIEKSRVNAEPPAEVVQRPVVEKLSYCFRDLLVLN